MQRITACIHIRKKNTCEYAKESTILLRWKGEQGKPVSISRRFPLSWRFVNRKVLIDGDL
jgi:hypothetical protein